MSDKKRPRAPPPRRGRAHRRLSYRCGGLRSRAQRRLIRRAPRRAARARSPPTPPRPARSRSPCGTRTPTRAPTPPPRRAEHGVHEEVPERHHQARLPILLRPQDHAETRPVLGNPAGRRPGQPGLPRHGRLREGRAAAARRPLRQGLRLGHRLPPAAARPQQVLHRRQDLEDRHSLRRLPDRRDRRRLLQQGQAEVTSAYRPRPLSPSSRARSPRPRPPACCPSPTATPTRAPGIHLFGVVHAPTAGKDEVRELVFNHGRAKWTGAGTVKAGRSLRTGPQGLPEPRLRRPERRPGRPRPSPGQVAFLVDGAWQAGHPRAEDGRRKSRLHRTGPSRRSDPAHPGRRGAGLGGHLQVRAPRRGRRLHQLPRRHRRHEGIRGQGQPPRASRPTSWKPAEGTVHADILEAVEGRQTKRTDCCRTSTRPPRPSTTPSPPRYRKSRQAS